jgi:hypothetical protein
MSHKKCHKSLFVFVLVGLLVGIGALIGKKCGLHKLIANYCKGSSKAGCCCEAESCDAEAENEIDRPECSSAETPHAERHENTPDVKSSKTTAKQTTTPAETLEIGDARYGEGSFIGQNHPAGFDIKGNERSMKYHLPGMQNYGRTEADVWFSNPEAAERAGFVRSQR